MKIDVGGVTINYEVEGKEGAPWVTFSNSLATNLHMWDDQAAALADEYRILRYDKRGHGDSSAPQGPYTFDDLVGDVVGLWDALGIEKCHFVGLSIGGMTAFGLALEHADRLDSMVVSNSRGDAPAAFVEAWDTRIATAEKEGMGAMAAPTVERWCSPSFFAAKPPALDKLMSMVASTSVEGFVGCARAIQKLDYDPHLSRIKVPTLFIAGKEDMATPADNMRRIHGEIPGSKFVELSPAGHVSNVEQPEAHTKAIREFLASVAA